MQAAKVASKCPPGPPLAAVSSSMAGLMRSSGEKADRRGEEETWSDGRQ
jgi:hypothetical protein